jgi:hypothetical protein
VDRLTVLCFTASSAVYVWEFVYDLSAVGGSYQLNWPFSVTISERCTPSWCGLLQNVYFCYDTYVKYDLLERVGETFGRNFAMKEMPANNHNLVNKLRSMGLLKHRRRVLTEEKLDLNIHLENHRNVKFKRLECQSLVQEGQHNC